MCLGPGEVSRNDRAELMEDWQICTRKESPKKIDPLK